jgi:hypothetical protein
MKRRRSFQLVRDDISRSGAHSTRLSRAGIRRATSNRKIDRLETRRSAARPFFEYLKIIGPSGVRESAMPIRESNGRRRRCERTIENAGAKWGPVGVQCDEAGGGRELREKRRSTKDARLASPRRARRRRSSRQRIFKPLRLHPRGRDCRRAITQRVNPSCCASRTRHGRLGGRPRILSRRGGPQPKITVSPGIRAIAPASDATSREQPARLARRLLDRHAARRHSRRRHRRECLRPARLSSTASSSASQSQIEAERRPGARCRIVLPRLDERLALRRGTARALRMQHSTVRSPCAWFRAAPLRKSADGYSARP